MFSVLYSSFISYVGKYIISQFFCLIVLSLLFIGCLNLDINLYFHFFFNYSSLCIAFTWFWYIRNIFLWSFHTWGLDLIFLNWDCFKIRGLIWFLATPICLNLLIFNVFYCYLFYIYSPYSWVVVNLVSICLNCFLILLNCSIIFFSQRYWVFIILFFVPSYLSFIITYFNISVVGVSVWLFFLFTVVVIIFTACILDLFLSNRN